MFTREDWTLFRNLGTLPHKAGVPVSKLRRLVLKELMDNALDAGPAEAAGVAKAGDNEYAVWGGGPGIGGGAAAVANLFSVRRPLTSTKILRMPFRGALGNGLRVVAGTVLATGGELAVHTRGRAYRLKPRDSGVTDVLADSPSAVTAGVRVELAFGAGLPEDDGDLMWARLAKAFAFTKVYAGKSSVWWYDSDSWRELLQAAGGLPLAELVAMFDGFGPGKKEADPADVLGGDAARRCDDLDADGADALLGRLRGAQPGEVAPKRLGGVAIDMKGESFARAEGVLAVRPARGGHEAKLPYVVEAWAHARESQDDEDEILAYVNGTPITGEVRVERRKPTKIAAFGCGLRHYISGVATRKFRVHLNVTTPYMPITTDGKSPDFERYFVDVEKAVSRASRKLKGVIRKAENRGSQKDIIVRQIPAGVAAASGGGKYRYSLRQLYYAVRPHVLDGGHPEVDYNHFARVITNYEAEKGDLEGMYRDPRGTLYHPHLRRDIPLGTLAVEEYERPEWTFNKILYCEKEGLTHLLKAEGWPERHDCALMSSKGFAGRAARDVLDLLGDTGEELTFFCIHDADASGGLIYQSLQEATTARAARRVKIINLGLEPWEALEMDLQVERFEVKGGKDLPVARYVRDYNDARPPAGRGWREWLQGRRVELNAMTSPQFVAWLDQKMAPHNAGKVVPPAPVLDRELRAATVDAARRRLQAEILREANFGARAQALADAARVAAEAGGVLRRRLAADLVDNPARRWVDPLREAAEALLDAPAPE